MLVVYTATACVLAGIGIFALLTGRRVWLFTTDPFVQGHLPFYAGIISQFAILMLCASAAICLFTVFSLPKKTATRKWRLFFLASCLFTALILFDDLFQMHKILFPEYFHVPESLVYSLYGIFSLMYVYYFRNQIVETEFLVAGLAFIFLGLALISDIIPFLPRGNTAFSDGLKILGIVSWLTYVCRTCVKAVKTAHSS